MRCLSSSLGVDDIELDEPPREDVGVLMELPFDGTESADVNDALLPISLASAEGGLTAFDNADAVSDCLLSGPIPRGDGVTISCFFFLAILLSWLTLDVSLVGSSPSRLSVI